MNKLSASIVAMVAMCATGCATNHPATTTPTPAPKAAPAAAAATVSGNWKISTETQQGTLESQLAMTQTGNALSGKMTSQMMGSVDVKGTVAGDKVTFAFDFDAQGQTIAIEYVGTLAGDTMDGTVSFGTFGTGPFKATRTK